MLAELTHAQRRVSPLVARCPHDWASRLLGPTLPLWPFARDGTYRRISCPVAVYPRWAKDWSSAEQPIRDLAILAVAGDQDVLRWFTLVVAILLDPAAVLLLPAATKRLILAFCAVVRQRSRISKSIDDR